MRPSVWPGGPYPLGATWDGAGVNFALFSAHATAVELWHRPDGGEMTEAEWRESTLRAFGYRLCGEAMDEVNERGEPVTGDTLLVLLNAQPEAVRFVLPAAHPGVEWEILVDTASPGIPEPTGRLDVGTRVAVGGRSLQLFRAWPPRNVAAG